MQQVWNKSKYERIDVSENIIQRSTHTMAKKPVRRQLLGQAFWYARC